MEIEAKFGLPDRATLERLRQVGHLGGYRLGEGKVREVRDVYLDTADRRILAAGHTCRWREAAGQVVVTLKSLSPGQGAVRRREELEMALPAGAPLDPSQWPPSPARERLAGWIRTEPPCPLFELHQTRTVRPVFRKESKVAEMSLDEVRATAGGRAHEYLELEIELQAQGNADDLAALVDVLTRERELAAEPRSKFERALAMLDHSSPASLLLSSEQETL